MSLLVSMPSKIKKMRMISIQKKKIQELENIFEKENERKAEKVEIDESELPMK